MPFDQEGYLASPRVEPTVTDDVLRVLIEARAFIADPRRFWQSNRGRACARDAACASLALNRVCRDDRIVDAADDALLRQLGARRRSGEPKAGLHVLYHFNDTHTHADVLALYDRAIAARASELAQQAE